MKTKSNYNVLIDGNLFQDIRIVLVTARVNLACERDKYQEHDQAIMADFYQKKINDIDAMLKSSVVNFDKTVRQPAFPVFGVAAA